MWPLPNRSGEIKRTLWLHKPTKGRQDMRDWGGACTPSRTGGKGCRHDGNIVPTWHIQTLQQANTILSKITASIQQQEDWQQEENSNASNSFGIASYSGQQSHNLNQGSPHTMSKLKTNSRRLLGASRMHTAQRPKIMEASCEIDSHANICCLGMNFHPIYFTGKIHDVSPFLNSMTPQANIEICTGATT